MKLPDDFGIGDYGQALYEKRDGAVELMWADCSGDNWKPRENDCHVNVTELCSIDSALVPVRGWLYYSFDDIGKIQFVAHSVVKAIDGQLYDITPPNTVKRPPFILSGDSEEFFECLVVNVGDFFFKYAE